MRCLFSDLSPGHCISMHLHIISNIKLKLSHRIAILGLSSFLCCLLRAILIRAAVPCLSHSDDKRKVPESLAMNLKMHFTSTTDLSCFLLCNPLDIIYCYSSILFLQRHDIRKPNGLTVYWWASATWQLDVAVLGPEPQPLRERDCKSTVLPEGDRLRMLPVLCCWYPVQFENENIEEHSPVCFKEVIKQIET